MGPFVSLCGGCAAQGEGEAGIEMNENRDGIVVLHPPQEPGFGGHPSDLRQLQPPRAVGWSREPFCLPWSIRRENPAENRVSEGSCLAGR